MSQRESKYLWLHKLQVVLVIYILLIGIAKLIKIPFIEIIYLLTIIYLTASKKLDKPLFNNPSFYIINLGVGLLLLFIENEVLIDSYTSFFNNFEEGVILFIIFNAYFIMWKEFGLIPAKNKE